MDQNFFQKTPKQTLEHLQVTSDGLTSAQAAQRLAQYGHNQLAEGKKKSVLAVFAEQFKDMSEEKDAAVRAAVQAWRTESDPHRP